MSHARSTLTIELIHDGGYEESYQYRVRRRFINGDCETCDLHWREDRIGPWVPADLVGLGEQDFRIIADMMTQVLRMEMPE